MNFDINGDTVAQLVGKRWMLSKGDGYWFFCGAELSRELTDTTWEYGEGLFEYGTSMTLENAFGKFTMDVPTLSQKMDNDLFLCVVRERLVIWNEYNRNRYAMSDNNPVIPMPDICIVVDRNRITKFRVGETYCRTLNSFLEAISAVIPYTYPGMDKLITDSVSSLYPDYGVSPIFSHEALKLAPTGSVLRSLAKDIWDAVENAIKEVEDNKPPMVENGIYLVGIFSEGVISVTKQ